MKHDPFAAVPDGARPAALAELSAAGPIHRLTLPTGVPAWLITGYEEGRALLNDPRIVKGGSSQGPFAAERPLFSAALSTHMLSSDPPDHTRLRKLVSMAFTRRRVERLAPRVEAISDELTEAMAGRLNAGDVVDLIGDFAFPLPIRVICELLGVPPEDQSDLRKWSAPLVAGSIVGIDAYSEAADAMLSYLHSLLADKRRDPADDLLSALIEAHDGTDQLTEDELTSMVYLLILAGHETTVGLISSGVRALLTHPEQLALLRAEPERLPAAVEEVIRFDGPAQAALPSVAIEPVEVAGQTIEAGEVVLVSIMAANRDPAHFPAPESFDISRDTGHIGFGHGIHHCLGAPLARLEGRIALEALITRFPDLELAVPLDSLERVPSLLINKLDELPVRRGR